MSPTDQCDFICSLLIKEQYLTDVLCGNAGITSQILKTEKEIPYSVIDPLVSTDSIRNLCTDAAYKEIETIICRKNKKPLFPCGTCDKLLAGRRSIACEKCLLWSHFSCTGLGVKPVGDWFCQKCIQQCNEGNRN